MSWGVRGKVGRVRLRASRAIGSLAGLALATPAVLAAIQIISEPWTHPQWLPIWRAALFGGVSISLVLALVGAVIAASKAPKDGSLRLEGSDLVLETARATRRVPFASVLSGVVVPQATGARIELALSSGDQLFAEVASIADGERALRTLGLDAAKRRCSVPLMPRSSRVLKRVGLIASAFMFSLIGLGIALGGGPLTRGSAAGWIGLTTLAIMVVVWLTRAREITIGADGVLLQQRIGTRFLRFEEIRAVKSEGHAVTFELAGEAREKVTLGKSASTETARTIALRIDEAIRARAVNPDPAAALAMIARAGRSLADWRAAISKLAQRAQSYRAIALSSDDLVSILENPGSSEEHRIGAAMGLLEGGGEQRSKVRIAASACASEPMRVALSKLADGEVDERAVEEALAEAGAAPAAERAYM